MSVDDLPLFAWSPPTCEIRFFPLARRTAKVRDVAGKLATKRTAKHIDQYREQVESALRHHLMKSGVPNSHLAGEILAFWRAVELEMARRAYRHHSGPGAA